MARAHHPAAGAPPRAGLTRAQAFAQSWSRARRVDYAAAARHSRLVAQLKIGLPIVALIIVAAVLVYSSVNGGRNGVALRLDSIDELADDLKMMNPKLTGVDREGRPYTVTASYAQQEKGRQDRVMLAQIEADITLEDGGWIAVAATTGQLDAKMKMMTLDGGISVYSDMGYEIKTRSADVDFDLGKVIGNEPVIGQGPLGVITGNAFEIDRTSKQVRFSGGVETTYIPPPRDDSAAASGTESQP